MSFLFLLVIVVVAWLIISYNKLQRASIQIKERASNVQVTINKKLSLINQLIDIVKNYQEGEQFVQLKIANDSTPTNLTNSYQQTGATLATLQGFAERFPNLKSNEQYHRLIDSIQKTEDEIQNSRQLYNRVVSEYNTERSKIPTTFIAKSLGFNEAPFLEFDMTGADVTNLKAFTTNDGERLNQLLSNAGTQISNTTRNMAQQAGSAGKKLFGKLKEEEFETLPTYFYVTNSGDVPKGPINLNELTNLYHQNIISTNTLVALVGSDNWVPITTIIEPASH